MANKGFGAKEINLIGIGTPTIESPTDLDVDVSGSVNLSNALDVDGRVDVHNDLYVDQKVDALEYFGDGVNLTGIVTQITAGIGIRVQGTEDPGKGVVNIDSYFPIGKTIFVTQNGNDNNSGLTENDSKRTIKAASYISFPGDTIKVYPGVYLEDNPITLPTRVSVEGTELRNCIVTPKNLDRDLFYVNNSCHVTDLSFIGGNMTNGAAIIALQPLLGVSTDRYFDASRMIRYNLDYIAKESVGFLTSGFSGFAGNHREQDAAKLIDLNIDYIASETVGFLTTGYVGSNGQPFIVTNSLGVSTDPSNCEDDIKDILRSLSYDLKSGSNKKVIGAGLSYYDNGVLQHVTGNDSNGNSIKQATIDAIQHSVGIVTYVVDNQSYPTSYTSLSQDTTSYIPISVVGGCSDTITTIENLSGIVTSILDDINNLSGITTIYGVTLESDDCADDLKDIWKCINHDITRGGNFKCVGAGKSYYDENWNLIPEILKNPGEVEQTIATLDYSFDIVRAVINNVSWGGFSVGIGTTVINADYDYLTGIATITANNHGLSINDPVKILDLEFSCPDSPPNLIYPSGNLGYIFNVNNVIDGNTFEVVVGQSTIPHTYQGGGTVQKYTNFQNDIGQLKDVAMQPDYKTGFNNAINGCSDVVSTIENCVGVVTTIVGLGYSSGIATSYPGNMGTGFSNIVGVTSAVYNNINGIVNIRAPGLNVKEGDIIEMRDLLFECSSGGFISTQAFPSGKYGYNFSVTKKQYDGSFDVSVGVSTLPHTYVSGGFIVNREVEITGALYDHNTGITTITAPTAMVKIGDVISLRNLEFSCSSGAGTTTIYPTGNNGYDFRVLDVIGMGQTFVVNTGKTTIPHTYEGGGVVFPTYSPGVGPITQGPYIRNCTNFVPGSVGMRVDGFEAEPGDKDDIGVTGTMSVDSYTQYNQGGIGVSITNGAYSQLVSIFTICDDIAIFTGSGGQCDLTNSNSSFGRVGLLADGVGDSNTKSLYRYTAVCGEEAEIEQDTIVIAQNGPYRPYDGQALYFGELYYNIQSITVTDGGSGYTQPPSVVIPSPTGPTGINAEAIATIDENGKVVSVDMVSVGSQYQYSEPPTIQFVGGNGIGASAIPVLEPIYYTIESATAPSSGISTVILQQNLNSTVSIGTTVYFSRLSLQITSSHSFEWVGSGNDINLAKPALGGVVQTDNEVIKKNGGQVIYTSTDQAGNFKIGDDITINQLTGTISGRAFSQSLLNTVTPLIIALSK